MAIEFDHLGGVRQSEGGIEIARNPLGLDPAAARVASIIEHGVANSDLRVGEPLGGIAARGIEPVERRKRVVARAQAIIVGLLDLGDDGLAALGQSVLIDPERMLFRRRVELDERALLAQLCLGWFRELGSKLRLDCDADRLGARERGLGHAGFGGGCRPAHGGGQSKDERSATGKSHDVLPQFLVDLPRRPARQVPFGEGQFARASIPISRILR